MELDDMLIKWTKDEAGKAEVIRFINGDCSKAQLVAFTAALCMLEYGQQEARRLARAIDRDR